MPRAEDSLVLAQGISTSAPLRREDFSSLPVGGFWEVKSTHFKDPKVEKCFLVLVALSGLQNPKLWIGSPHGVLGH